MALTSGKAAEAADYNRRKAGETGWRGSYAKIVAVIGSGAAKDASAFAQAVCAWQGSARPTLTDDGKLGPKTWAQLKPRVDAFVGPLQNLPVPAWLGGPITPGTSDDPADPGPRRGGACPWMDYAAEEKRTWDSDLAALGFGARYGGGERALTRDERYFHAAPRWGDETHALGVDGSDNAHWCAAFVNYCLHRAGYSHTGSAGAHSFIWKWAWYFDALTEPRRGCVIVVGDSEGFDGKGKGAHVAFLDSWHNLPRNPGGHVHNIWGRGATLLGGNQNNRVTSRREPTKPQDGKKARKRDFLAVRGQNGVTSPYLWPKVGPPKCSIGDLIATEQPHHCHYIPKAVAGG